MRAPHRLVVATLLSAIAFASCRDTSIPTMPEAAPSAAQAAASGSAPKFWDVGATAYWNERATALSQTRTVDAGRVYAYLSLAQYRAAMAARATRPHPPTSSAIAAASVVVLKQFFPLDAGDLEALLDAQQAAEPWPGAKHEDIAAGEALGRTIGAAVLAFAASDLVGLTNPGTPPTGDGFWKWSGGPIARGGLGARPFFMTSGSQFRAAPPPAYGEAAYLAAAAEVLQIATTRTPQQIAIANFWNVNQSAGRNIAFSNVAVELIRSHRVKDEKAAEIMLRVYAATFDAAIGCFDSKYHYWYVRPAQANPLITTVFNAPPHPSYPSGHSCISGAMSGALSAEFPDAAGMLHDMAIEASLSRLYAGIHYRFDMEAGLKIGQSVANLATHANLDAIMP